MPLTVPASFHAILERRSIPPGCVARRLNGVTIRTPRALSVGRLDVQKREVIISRALRVYPVPVRDRR